MAYETFSGANLDTQVSGRIMNSGTMYRLRVRTFPSGEVELAAIKAANGTWSISQAQLIDGLSMQPGEELNVRFQIVDTNPTTLRAKVWRASEAEPVGWHFAVTDSEPILQGSGSFGLTLDHKEGGSGPVTFLIDDLLVTNVTEPPVQRALLEEAIWERTASRGSVVYLPIVVAPSPKWKAKIRVRL